MARSFNLCADDRLDHGNDVILFTFTHIVEHGQDERKGGQPFRDW